jgi:hypothetical protein
MLMSRSDMRMYSFLINCSLLLNVQPQFLFHSVSAIQSTETTKKTLPVHEHCSAYG